ncbi:Arc family DNA-binding protein [Kaistia sp. MMO-174]|uniref:Arc family DNA-binding protein n=1 Tax=Kaistia sp. MMO-174 TaxID=3081256 RepID=UPI0030170D98
MSQDTPSRVLDKIVIRVPDGLRDRIAAAARANNRSVNAELVQLLEATYPPESTIEDVIYWAHYVTDQFEDAPQYSKLQLLREALMELAKKLDQGRREGYPPREEDEWRKQLGLPADSTETAETSPAPPLKPKRRVIRLPKKPDDSTSD